MPLSVAAAVMFVGCWLSTTTINAAEFERLWSLIPQQEVKQIPQYELPEPRPEPPREPIDELQKGEEFCGDADQLSDSLKPL